MHSYFCVFEDTVCSDCKLYRQGSSGKCFPGMCTAFHSCVDVQSNADCSYDDGFRVVNGKSDVLVQAFKRFAKPVQKGGGEKCI